MTRSQPDPLITALGFTHAQERLYVRLLSQSGRELVSVAEALMTEPDPLTVEMQAFLDRGLVRVDSLSRVFVASPAEALATVPSVLGPTVPWSQAAHSVSRARDAWLLHARGLLGPEQHVRADDHVVDLLLAGDLTLSADLVRRRLAPLAAMTPTGRARAEQTWRAWLDCHGDVTLTAEALHVHPQTVRYRLGLLRDDFGGALDDAGSRLELSLALRAHRFAPPGS